MSLIFSWFVFTKKSHIAIDNKGNFEINHLHDHLKVLRKKNEEIRKHRRWVVKMSGFSLNTENFQVN
jgi:hypothetical protein